MHIEKANFFLQGQGQNFPQYKQAPKKKVPGDKLINVAQQYFAIVDLTTAFNAGIRVLGTGSVSPCVVLFMWMRTAKNRDYLCLGHIDSSACDGTRGFTTTNLIPALSSEMQAFAGDTPAFKGAVVLTGASPDKTSVRIITCARALLKAKGFTIPGQAIAMKEKSSKNNTTVMKPVANLGTTFGMLLKGGEHMHFYGEKQFLISPEDSYKKCRQQDFVRVGRLDDDLTETERVQVVGSGYNATNL